MKSTKTRPSSGARRPSPKAQPGKGRRAGSKAKSSSGSRAVRSSGKTSHSAIGFPLAAVGSLAAVILAGLVFWGLDSGETRSHSREVVVASHLTAEAQAPKVKGSATPSPEKPASERPASEPAPHAARAGLEKPSTPPEVTTRSNGSAESAPISKVEHQESPKKDGRPERPMPEKSNAEPPPDAARAGVEKTLKPRDVPVPTNGAPEAAPAPTPKVQSQEIARKDFQIEPEKREKLALNIVPPSRPEPPPESLPPRTPARPPVARVAIVIDDLGQDLEFATKLASVPLPITFSVMPFQKYSKEVIALARASRRETMLHMPMEPEGYPRVDPGNGALLVSMSPQQIQIGLGNALGAVSPINGINNHMGSRFTESAEQMGIVMKELRRRGLFFLDSATTAQTVALDAAQQQGVPYVRRDIFLDHVLVDSFVRAQLGQLIRKAKIEGTALGIGHPHEVTLNVLRQESAVFEREGIAVVPAGQLVQRNTAREKNR